MKKNRLTGFFVLLLLILGLSVFKISSVQAQATTSVNDFSNYKIVVGLGPYDEKQDDSVGFDRFSSGGSFVEDLATRYDNKVMALDSPSREDWLLTMRGVNELNKKYGVFPKKIKKIEINVRAKTYSTNPSNSDISPLLVDYRYYSGSSKEKRQVFRKATDNLDISLGDSDSILINIQPETNGYFPGGIATVYFSDNTTFVANINKSRFFEEYSGFKAELVNDTTIQDFASVNSFKPGTGKNGRNEDWHIRLNLNFGFVSPTYVAGIYVTNRNMISGSSDVGCFTDSRVKKDNDLMYPLVINNKSTWYKNPTDYDDDIDLDYFRYDSFAKKGSSNVVDLYCQKDDGVLDFYNTSNKVKVFLKMRNSYYSDKSGHREFADSIIEVPLTVPDIISTNKQNNVFIEGEKIDFKIDQKALSSIQGSSIDNVELFVGNKSVTIYSDSLLKIYSGISKEIVSWTVPLGYTDKINTSGKKDISSDYYFKLVISSNGSNKTVVLPVTILKKASDNISDPYVSDVMLNGYKELKVLPLSPFEYNAKVNDYINLLVKLSNEIPSRRYSQFYLYLVNSNGDTKLKIYDGITSGSVGVDETRVSFKIPEDLAVGEYKILLSVNNEGGNNLPLNYEKGVYRDGLNRYQIGKINVKPDAVADQYPTILKLSAASGLKVAQGGFTFVSVDFLGYPTKVAQRLFVHAIDEKGNMAFKADASINPQTITWKKNSLESSFVSLNVPENVTPGKYKLAAGLYTPGSAGLPLIAGDGVIKMKDGVNRYIIGDLTVTASGLPTSVPNTPTTPVTTEILPPTINSWSSSVNTNVVAGNTFSFNVYFQGGATKLPQRVFVHILDKNGNMILKGDTLPPTSSDKWNGNTVVVPMSISIPSNFAPGIYKVTAGLYTTGSLAIPLTAGYGVVKDYLNRYQIGSVNITAPVVTTPNNTVITPVTNNQNNTSTQTNTNTNTQTNTNTTITTNNDLPIVVTPSSGKAGSTVVLKLKYGNSAFNVNDFFFGQYGFESSGFKVIDGQNVQLTIPLGIPAGSYDIGWFGPSDTYTTKFTVTAPTSQRYQYLGSILDAFMGLIGIER